MFPVIDRSLSARIRAICGPFQSKAFESGMKKDSEGAYDNGPHLRMVNRKKKLQAKRQTKREIGMCYNCGCGMPNNDMGNPANITNKTFEEAAKAMKQSAEDAKKNARQLLDKVINTKEQSNEKNWKP
jgi:hypothetical protein